MPRTTWVSRYQKGKTRKVKTKSGFTGARYSEWQWHLLGYMQVCTSSQTATPTSHHSVFYRPDALPAAEPTASKPINSSVDIPVIDNPAGIPSPTSNKVRKHVNGVIRSINNTIVTKRHFIGRYNTEFAKRKNFLFKQTIRNAMLVDFHLEFH